MTAIGLLMFVSGMLAVGFIGKWPGMAIGASVLLWTFGGLGLFFLGIAVVLWRVMP
ncbi:hypothetical protein [Paraburkholderia sp. RL18-085-BIA-A]|uniref:hypothetical protein n=1 Tax=Paraburkholderia sp. RL18-085-BIA-A TaxID=3031633 RepID=UPI0038BD593F